MRKTLWKSPGPMTTVAVTMCTFRRPQAVETLRSVDSQRLPDRMRLRIIVVDNDTTDTARPAIEAAATKAIWPVSYVHAPAGNISIARNAGLEAAGDVDWVAFLDDDEIAEPGWLATLLDCAQATGADGVFGPSLARYGDLAPPWIRAGDYHSNIPTRNAGSVITGHTCNALLRWNGAPWTGARFDLSRGRSGGEDTAFFLDLYKIGARFEICLDAVVKEEIEANRLTFRWLARRRYRSGQSFAAFASGRRAKISLIITASAKLLSCGLAAIPTALSTPRRNYWLLRGILHAGVVAGCINLAQAELYGIKTQGQI